MLEMKKKNLTVSILRVGSVCLMTHSHERERERERERKRERERERERERGGGGGGGGRLALIWCNLNCAHSDQSKTTKLNNTYIHARAHREKQRVVVCWLFNVPSTS